MNDYIARFRVNDFEKQELKEHIREVQKLAAAMGKRVDLRRPVSSKELHSDKKARECLYWHSLCAIIIQPM